MSGKIKKHVSPIPHSDENKDKRPAASKWPIILISLGVLMGLAALVAGLTIWYYNDRALPNVTVAGASVGQKSRSELRQVVANQAKAMSVTFVDGASSTTVLAKELGVWIDTEATINHIMQAHKTGDSWQRFELWQPVSVPLVIDNDPGVLKSYIKQHFSNAFVDAKDAHVVYNDASAQFDVQPAENGKGFDIKSFERALPDLVHHPRNVTLALSTLPTPPIIPTPAAVQTQAEANARLKLLLQFTLNGSVVYTAGPGDIAAWMHFIPDPAKGTMHIEYDKAKIQQFLAQRVGASIASPPVERKVLVDSSGAQTVLQPGATGKQLRDVDLLADQVLNAVSTNRPFDQEVAVVEAPFKTVTITSSDKWIEVDLAQQRVTMYADDKPVQSFLISSGTAAHPTIPGEFHIWYKTPSQTMTERSNVTSGDYFYLPNVKWVSYFDGDRAFHGTYWHHNFGHPMSHGCINMTEADAKILYDFAPVGTRVVVHA